jgi:predicted RNase H-like nuclease (RuvC/YqgF family)
MQATGISDLELLVNKFIKGEEQNFALFKFVNELNSEIDNYETQIFEMQSEIDRNLQDCGHDSYKRKAIKELEVKLVKTRQDIDKMKKIKEENTTKIIKIKDQI